ncbi:MAG: dsbB, partial [Rhodospirillales bacterium]|nr:dsbB [Rhodospirillales bacterium]
GVYIADMSTNPRTLIAATLLLSLAVICFVLLSQYVQFYQPCELCVRERLPWYLIIVLGLIGLAFPSRWILVAIGVALLVSAGLGLHHSGVEQRWWPGPAECTGGSSGANSIDELRAVMHREKVVQCDAIAWTLFGISMATYNFLISLAAGIAVLILTLRGRHAR